MDEEQELVAGRGEAAPSRDLLGDVFEAPDPRSEVGGGAVAPLAHEGIVHLHLAWFLYEASVMPGPMALQATPFSVAVRQY